MQAQQTVTPCNAVVFNGREYARYSFYVNSGHAYFMTDTLYRGSVMYDGVACDNVRLLYDEVADQLITNDITNIHLVQLVKQKVDSFSIGDHRFIHIRKDKEVPDQPETGYYEVIHDRKIRVLKKEKKQMRQNISLSTGPERSFQTEYIYYIKYKNKHYKVNSQKSLLSVFGESKKQLRQFISQNNLSYIKSSDEFIARSIAFAETLTP